MPRRGSKEIIKKDKNIFFDQEKSGKRRGRDRLVLKPEKFKRDQYL